jgi:hypothetical protein
MSSISHVVTDFTVIDGTFAIENDWHCLKGKYTSEQSEVYDQNAKCMSNPKYVIDIWYKAIGSTAVFQGTSTYTSIFIDDTKIVSQLFGNLESLFKTIGIGRLIFPIHNIMAPNLIMYKGIDIGTEKEIDDAHSYLKLPSKEELGYNSKVPLGFNTNKYLKKNSNSSYSISRSYNKYYTRPDSDTNWGVTSAYFSDTSNVVDSGGSDGYKTSGAKFLGSSNFLGGAFNTDSITIKNKKLFAYKVDNSDLGFPFNTSVATFIPRLFNGYIMIPELTNVGVAAYICLGVHPISDDE